jgi:hypothetical protein
MECIFANYQDWANFRLWVDCLLLVNFENQRSSKNNWATVFQSKSYVLILTKNGLGYILGDYFKNLWSPY